jgi:aerobic-type carbon monoxide dehydrogenase small subunit (CoxS/CutS family)
VRLLHARVPDDRAGRLQERDDWDRAGLRERLSGNLCRCTGYQTIVDAVLAAAAAAREDGGHAEGAR